RHVDLADRVILGIDDEHVARRVAADPLGSVEARSGTRTVEVALVAGAGERGDGALGVHLSDRVSLALAEVGGASPIDADRPRAVDDRFGCQPTVALLGRRGPTLLSPHTGERADDAALQVDPADAPVPHVRDQQAPLAVEDAVVRLDELR